MKTRFLFAVLISTAGLTGPLSSRGQVYSFTSTVSGYTGVDLSFGGESVGGSQIQFGTLNETVFYNSNAQTIRHLGTVTFSPSNVAFGISSGPFGTASGSASLTINGGNTNLAFDSGVIALNTTWGLAVPVSGTCTVVNNGQTNTGPVSYTVSVPILTSINSAGPSSLNLSEASFMGAMQGQQVAVIGGVSLVDGTSDGTYYYSWHVGPVSAALLLPTFVVTNLLDSGPGSLRQAITNANTTNGGNIIFSNVTGTIVLTNGQLALGQSNMNIIGPGPANIVVSGNNTNRVFYLAATAAGTFSGLAIENGYIQGPGGGVCNFGNLVLSNCLVASNSTHLTNSFGGGIYNSGMLALTNCTVIGNFASDFAYAQGYPLAGGLGGGIFNAGSLTLYQTLVVSNLCTNTDGIPGNDTEPNAAGDGGGLYNSNSATIILSTIADNGSGDGQFGYEGDSPGGRGGGIYNIGSLTIFASTVSSNVSGYGGSSYGDGGWPGSPGGGGAGIWNSGTLAMTSSTLRGNVCGDGGVGYSFNVYLQLGGAGGSGGGVFNTGVCAVTNCSFVNNKSGDGGNGSSNPTIFDITQLGSGGNGGGGGGLFSQGSVSLLNCTLFANGTGNGGASSQAATFNSQSYGGNGGNGGTGGGILNQGSIDLSNCTLFANSVGNGGSAAPATQYYPAGNGGSGGSGGALWLLATNATLVNCTISSNSTGVGMPGGAPYPTNYPTPGMAGTNGVGGGIGMGGGAIQLLDTIVAGDATSGSGPDVFGSVTSQGYNLIGNTAAAAGFGASGDLLNVNLLLGPLTNNGGPTLTCALLPGSPAIDAGVAAGLATDQRGVFRPQGAAPDIGAFEYVPPPHLTGSGLSNCVFTFKLYGPAGTNYVIQSSSNLVQWISFLTNTMPPAGFLTINDSNACGQTMRFYRALPQ